LHRARGVGSLYQPGELRAFEFHQAGQTIGRSWSRYDGETADGNHRFSTRVELTPPKGEVLRSASEIVVDDHGRLISGFERSAAAQLQFNVSADRLEMAAFTGLPVQERETLKFGPEAAFVGYMATIHQEIMFATRDLHRGEQGWRLIFLSSGRPHEWDATVSPEGDGLRVRTSLGESIFFENQRIMHVRVADDDLEVTVNDDGRWPLWAIETPRALVYVPSTNAKFVRRSLELTGRENEPRLAGEVLLPTELERGAQRPGILFLGGGSPADRYGFAGPPAVDLGFHEITDALAQAGFVVLRYDERGLGESEAAEMTWTGQREDARRALRMLLVQPEVDPDQIVVVGHGEGGWRALQLAAERPDEVVGVALLAAPGRGYRAIFARHPGLLASIEKGQGLPPNLALHREWYRQILKVDPSKLVRDVRCPIWIAQGDKDFEVDALVATEHWRRAVRKHHTVHEIARFEMLDHIFKSEHGESSFTSYLADRPVDSEFLGSLIDWVEARTKSTPGNPR